MEEQLFDATFDDRLEQSTSLSRISLTKSWSIDYAIYKQRS